MVDQTVYLSGCIGLDPATADLVPGGIEPEAEQVWTSLFVYPLWCVYILEYLCEKVASTNIVHSLTYLNVIVWLQFLWI